MNDFLLEQLAVSINLNDSVSQEKGKRLVKSLTQQDLKKFLSRLKIAREKTSITIISADTLGNTTKKELEKKFGGAHVQYALDPKIGAGIKVKTYDMIYDLTVKGRLEKLAQEVESEI